jgi:hypothetical protein
MTIPDDGGFSIWAKIEAHLGSAGKKLDRLAQMQATAMKQQQPVFSSQALPAQANAAGIATFNFDGPTQGFVWHLRQFTVGGLAPNVAAAGRADVYVNGSDPQSAATLTSLGMEGWRDTAASLPAVAFYSNGAIVLRPNDDPMVIITNGTPGQTYVSVCRFEQVQEGASQIGWAT